MGGHGTEVEVRSTNNFNKGIYSNKKKPNDKFGKTQKRLPDLTTGGYNENYQKHKIGGGFASDSDEYMNGAQQLPMIKGGGSIHAQNVQDAYTFNNTNQASGAGVVMGPGAHMGGKNMKKPHGSGFNNKYISGNVSTHHNQSQSPASQTFFKDPTKKAGINSLIKKQGWVPLNKGKKPMYVSPYSKNPNPK
eukprot:CAMPEP_0170509438 /NCGR_PEP_ID=MMETSP0208-20121228/65216_1 /TAXON_ID=197538 /ORGANISM="Strombidium inclinatum, Strain S3" /LENGTH=190 /DNA_ID=CAMNT_0010792801 /DNA_START=1442 /DNA_END=2014 /DNA_ORIENTATION=-